MSWKVHFQNINCRLIAFSGHADFNKAHWKGEYKGSE